MRKSLWVVILVGAMLAGAATLTALVQRPGSSEHDTPPGSPIAARDLLYACPFTLQHTYPFAWRAERPSVGAGWLLVIQTDPALCVPSQEYERVLYVGEQTAERINTGQESGRIIAVVPAALGADGAPDLELTKALIFWGAPRLPEQVDAQVVQSEWAHAASFGITALSPAQIEAARTAGGPSLAFAERDELVRHAARLIKSFAPAETEFAQGLLAPRIR